MALGIEQIDDFVAGIHQKYIGEDRLAAQDLSLPLQSYKYASRLFSGNLSKDTMSTSQCKWKIKIDTNDNFQVVGLYHRDSSNRVNVLSEGSLKWGLTTNNYHYDIDEEIFQTGGRQIYDYMASLERDLMTSFYTGMEDIVLQGFTGVSSTEVWINNPDIRLLTFDNFLVTALPLQVDMDRPLVTSR